MPRDARLYMTFPIDFHRHPKVRALSDAAFRAFVEANGESRILESDGVLKKEDAEFLWKVQTLSELLNSHPTRPLLLFRRNRYILRQYAEHQFTRLDRENLSNKRAEAGRKGGQAIAKQLLSKTKQTEAESGLESGDLLQDLTTSSYVLKRASKNDDSPRFAKPLKGGGLDLNRVDAAIRKHTQRTATVDQVQEIVTRILGRASGKVTSPTGLVVKAIETDWSEWQKLIDGGDS